VLLQTVEVMVTSVQTPDSEGPGPVHVYPNPTDGLVTVEFPSAGERLLEVRVCSADGKVWLRQPVENTVDRVQFDLGTAPAGAYLLELVFTSGRLGRTVLRL
jgi:hypothetical protein